MGAETPFVKMFCLLFGETLAAFLGLLVTIFFTFHIWLMIKAMTTIEFCEKSMKRAAYDPSVYDKGWLGNIKAVLGDNPLRVPPHGGRHPHHPPRQDLGEADGGGPRHR